MLEGSRGIGLGLWILTGLAFLLEVLLPGNAGAGTAAPILLALAVAWTALLPHSSSRVIPERERGDVSFGGPPRPPSAHARGVQSEASALRTSRSVRQRGRPEHPAQDEQIRQPLWTFLTLLGTTAALATALAIIHTGDRRSFIFLGLTAVLSLALALAAQATAPAR